MTKERLEGINKLKNFINSLDDSADADDFHKFVDTCQINYEEGTFNEILRFMQSQAERVRELEKESERYQRHLFEARNDVASQSRKLRKAKVQNKRYRRTLEFYADRKSWELGDPYEPRDCDAWRDQGSKARQALESESDE